jgi:hypothetical protein
MTDDIAFTAVGSILGLYYFYLNYYDGMSKSRQKGFQVITGLVIAVVLLTAIN